MVITMAKLRMVHASKHGARKPPGLMSHYTVQYCTFNLLLTRLNLFLPCTDVSDGNPDAKRLYDDIMSGYNKLVRPVRNVTDPVTVKFKLKLSQLIDVVSK